MQKYSKFHSLEKSDHNKIAEARARTSISRALLCSDLEFLIRAIGA